LEEHAAGPKPGSLKDEAAERLRQLEAEVQRLKEQMAAPAASEEAAAEGVPEPAPEEEEEPRELTPGEQAELESLIKQAQLARIRKQGQTATDLMKKAAAIAPSSPVVLEALGDDLAARGMYQLAKDAYAKAKKYDPENVALDRKHGEAVYFSDARAAGMMLSFQDENFASGSASIWLSLFAPGVGQMVRGKWVKGTIIFAGFLISLAILALMRTGDPKQTQDAKFSMLVPLGAAFGFWIWGFLDSQVSAKGVGKRQINRPRPPVDLPFE
jgi:tetratricopeptide (TPR) repeat protein